MANYIIGAVIVVLVAPARDPPGKDRKACLLRRLRRLWLWENR